MSELSDTLYALIRQWDRDTDIMAVELLASPVIRRIQAEAIRDAATDTRNAPTSDPGTAWFNNDSAKWLEERADRIEKGGVS